ncbi:AsmA family protein [Pararobbsia silviterrae]|uniref:AsmA family protein n=1 Tax=Pararobbsia silviterrae TaxID=1792498 RepID=A0A494XY17_9BURK|nr:AsmA family protein [Pararobbsia silviterrae]RKP54825.1 AsmA family protein [Pararobbsia silviterrae]
MTTPVRRIVHASTRTVAYALAGLVLLVAMVVIVFVTFDWNRARPWVDDKVSAAISRPFAIHGDLRLDWRRPVGETGWRAWIPWPRFSAKQITIGNPDWAAHPQFATLDEIDFEVEVLPLLARRIVVPTIDLVAPAIDLERQEDGTNNWTFRLPSDSTPSEWKLDLHDIAFARATIALADAQHALKLDASVDTLGQPVPIGEAIREQSQASHAHSAEVLGAKGAAKLADQASAASAAEGPLGASSAQAVASSAEVGTASAAAASSAAAAQSSDATAAKGPMPDSAADAGPGETHERSGQRRNGEPVYALAWTVRGTYKKDAVHGEGKLGGILALQDARRPYPIAVDLAIGDTRIALVGTLSDPAHLAALDLRLWLQGRSIARLYDITGVALPETPPYATDGHLIARLQGEPLFRYEDFTGRIGGSDINGTLVYRHQSPRPMLTGTLVSNLLQFSDLGPLVGADSRASRLQRGDTTSQPVGKVLPVEAFHTDRWKTLDADVRFTGRRIIRSAALPINDLYAHLLLDDGVLTLDPLRFGVAGGSIAGTLHLDGSADPLAGRFAIEARHLRLKQLFPTFEPMKTSLGEVNGDAALSATGNSPARLAATSNGEVKVLVNDGQISNTLLEAAGLNVANVVYDKVFGDKTTHIQCAAADLVFTNGTVDPRVFALDTDDALINVDGKVDLRDEVLDLTIHPHTKGFRVFSLRSPLYVGGTFAKPKVGVDIPMLALRGGAVVGLALLNPFAALIPLLAPSNVGDSPCAQMFARMRTAPSAPPPGVTEPPPGKGKAGNASAALPRAAGR